MLQCMYSLKYACTQWRFVSARNYKCYVIVPHRLADVVITCAKLRLHMSRVSLTKPKVFELLLSLLYKELTMFASQDTL